MHNMTNDQLVLQVNKINISPDKTYVKYNQNERGKVLDVTVIDNDGINAYDLTNKKIRFVDDKENNKLIVDDEADNPNRFTRTNDSQGKFSYTLNDLAYQRSGIARFEIYTDADHIDATSNFEIQIENMTSTVVANESYISSLEGLVAHHRSTIDTTETETNQLIDSLNKQIAQAISDGNKSVADEVSSIKEIIQQMQTEYKSKSDTLAKLTSDWQTQTQTIQNSADDQLKTINDNAKSEIDKLKQDAIKTVSDAKDQAISAANKAYKDQLGAFQTDYTTWKNTTVADFQKQLHNLNQEITTETNTQNDLKQAVSDAVNTMQTLTKKLDGYDFTKFVTDEQIKNYPTKDEVKAMMDNAGKVKTVDNIQPDNNGNINTDHYTKDQANQKLATKLTFVKCDSPQAAYDASKKPADDGSLVIGIYDPDDGPTSAVIGDKTITISSLYESLQNLQTQVSGLSGLQSLINGKANSADVYLKTDIDNTVAQLREEIRNAGKLKTISIDGGTPASPDTSGNVNIDLSKKADISSLQALDSRVTALENKPGDIVAVTQAQYDQLVKDGKVQQNVIYAVSTS